MKRFQLRATWRRHRFCSGLLSERYPAI